MIFWLYLAEVFDTVNIYAVALFWILTIILCVGLGFGIFALIDLSIRDSRNFTMQNLVKARRKIWFTIKRTKVIYIYICLALFNILTPSKSLIYTKLALDTGSIVLEKLIPLQEKALKSIELYLDDYIKDKEKETNK